MIIFLPILSGLVIAVLKVAIEYSWWDKKKSESTFHAIGASIVLLLCIIAYFISYFKWEVVAIMIISYWNAFEMIGNVSHNQYLFYTGESAYFDKLLRSITKYHEALKAILHLLSIILLIIISIHLLHEKV